MSELFTLPSYYQVSTTCITRLLIAKLILFFTFFSEPWSALSTLLIQFIRTIPGFGEMNVSPVPLITPLLSMEMVADTMVLMGLCWKSRFCLTPWLCLNMLTIFMVAFSLVNKVLNNLAESVTAELKENTKMEEVHLMVSSLCLAVLLSVLCYQYSGVLEIYFHIHRNTTYDVRKKESTVEKTKIYPPVNKSHNVNVFNHSEDKTPGTLYTSSLSESLSLLSSSQQGGSTTTTSMHSSFQQNPSPANSFTQNPSPTNSFTQNPSPLDNIPPNTEATNLNKENSQSFNLLDTRSSSITFEADNTRNSWNTFKFSYDDEKFA